MRAFRNRILPIMAFSTKFENTPLEGTNIVRVPYYALASGASQDWNPATGYVPSQTQTISSKPVTVDKRKFRGVSFTSDEFNRQPYLSAEKLLMLEAEKLADDVLTDIFSLVTAANYAGTTVAAMAASAFDLDDVLTLRRLCGEANWPMAGRGLVLDGTFAEYLLRDSRVQNRETSGEVGAVTEGRLPKVGGFQPYEVPLLPANGAEKIAGMAVYPSAILAAFAPIRAHPLLQRTLVDYQVITDPDTGLSLEYRAFGNATLDTVTEVIECNYGYAVGEGAALKRITTP
jgi:hypothetical protein